MPKIMSDTGMPNAAHCQNSTEQSRTLPVMAMVARFGAPPNGVAMPPMFAHSPDRMHIMRTALLCPGSIENVLAADAAKVQNRMTTGILGVMKESSVHAAAYTKSRRFVLPCMNFMLRAEKE